MLSKNLQSAMPAGYGHIRYTAATDPMRLWHIIPLTVVAFVALYVGSVPLVLILFEIPIESRPYWSIFLDELPVQVIRAWIFAVLYFVFSPAKHSPAAGALLGGLVGLIVLSTQIPRLSFGLELADLIEFHRVLLGFYAVNVGAWVLAGFLLAYVSRRFLSDPSNAAV